MNRNTKIIITIAIIIFVAAAGFFAFRDYFLIKICEGQNCSPAINDVQSELMANENQQPTATTTKKLTAPKAETLMASYKLYKNAEFGFEIQYPNSWIVSEENIENVRGENTKALYFKKPNSDVRFAILPRDGLSYGLPDNGVSSDVVIGGLAGSQQKWALSNGRRLWLLYPKYGLHNWSEDIGRIDVQSSATDPLGDTAIFEKMLNSFKLAR